MNENISPVFNDCDGNALFCLQTAVIFSAGIIALLSNQINISPNIISDTFIRQVDFLIKQKSVPDLRVIN